CIVALILGSTMLDFSEGLGSHAGLALAVVLSLAAFGPISAEWKLVATNRIQLAARNRMVFEGAALVSVCTLVSSCGLFAYMVGCLAGVLAVSIVNRKELAPMVRNVRIAVAPSVIMASASLCLLGVASHVWLRIPIWVMTEQGSSGHPRPT